MPEEIIISDRESLEKTKKSILKDGPQKVHILADFDKTLTRAFVGGKSTPSLISILRDENYLTADYTQTTKKLYEKYHLIEISPEIPLAEKKKLINEWYVKVFNLLIDSGLTKEILEKVINSDRVQFRQGFNEFIDILKINNIPLVIMSASGLGEEAISMFLEKEGKLYENIHIVSNSFQWDENGRALAVKEPIIHSMNKDETLLENFPFFQKIENRKNVILLGDNLEDINMVLGFGYDNLLKVGFLNEKTEESLEHYKKAFDVVILNDVSLNYINNLLKEII